MEKRPEWGRSIFGEALVVINLHIYRQSIWFLKVYFTFKLAWRRSGGAFCDDNVILNRDLIGGDGVDWQCTPACSEHESIGSGVIGIESSQIHCTSFSEVEDWSQGERSFNYSFPNEGPFTIRYEEGYPRKCALHAGCLLLLYRYSSCCWISGLNLGGGSWSIITTVDLNRRLDTNQINSSPISATSPIIRFQEGCYYNFAINTDDPDGDEVRCRWSVGDECGGVCNALEGATLDQVHMHTLYISVVS